MTRRINQKLAVKRRKEEQEEELKAAKKAKKAEKKLVVQKEMKSGQIVIVDRLVAGGEEALRAHALLASGEEVVLDEFYTAGGKASHVLHVLDTSETKTKANEVAAVFHSVEVLVLRAAQGGGSAPTMQETAIDLVKKVLGDYGREVVLLLSGTNTAFQAKSVLRMLTAMVTLSSAGAREVLSKVSWDSDSWETLPKRSSRDQPDVRTCFIHLLLAFLFDSSREVVREFLESRHKQIASIFPGMMHDPVATVNLVLDTLTAKLLENPLVSKTSRMKVFGSHNVKLLLSLLAWTGPKGTEASAEDKSEVEEHTIRFLSTLLGNNKHGVVFPDPDLGCGDRSSNINPLAREVVQGLTKPWERPSLWPVLGAVVGSCPGTWPIIIQGLGDTGTPRDSIAWVQVADMLSFLLSHLSLPAPNYPTPNLLQAITVKLLIPPKLLNLLAVGVKESEVAVVTDRCLAMLCQVVKVVKKFTECLNKEARATVTAACKSHLSLFPKLQQVIWRWKETAPASERASAALDCLHIASFLLHHGAPLAAFSIEELLHEVEIHKEALGEHGGDAQLEALRMFHHIAASNSSSKDPALVASLCKQEVLAFLVAGIVSDDKDKASTSTRILSSLIKESGLTLKSGDDIALLIALAGSQDVELVSKCLVEAVNRKDELKEKILELDLLRLPAKCDPEELFQKLMDPDFKPEQVITNLFGFIESRLNVQAQDYVLEEDSEEVLSPLILSIVEQHKEYPTFVQLFILKMTFLFDDKNTFARMIKEFSGKSNKVLKKFVFGCLEEKMEDSIETVLTLPSWVLVRSSVCHLVQLAAHEGEEQEAKLLQLLGQAPQENRKRLLKMILHKKTMLSNFDPYMVSKYDPTEASCGLRPELVVEFLRMARQVGLDCSEFKNQFLETTDNMLSGKQSGTENGKLVMECLAVLPLTLVEIEQLVEKLIILPVTEFSTKFPVTDLFSKDRRHTTMGHLLTGCCLSLASLSASILTLSTSLPSLLTRLSSHLEFLLSSCSDDVDSLATALSNLLATAPSLAPSFSENLTLVCANNASSAHIELLKTLLSSSHGHLNAFKGWVLENKTRMTSSFWTLFPVLFGDDGLKLEKKFVTIVLKGVAKEVEAALAEPSKITDQRRLLELVQYLCQFTRSEKQLELWTSCLGTKKESSADEAPPPVLLLLRCTLLMTLQNQQGGLDSRLMKEAFIPLLSSLTTVLKPPKSPEEKHDTQLVTEMSKFALDIKGVTENKIFSKELNKSMEVWEGFQRSALRHCLKLGEQGADALQLLSEVTGFLQAGGKFSGAEATMDLVTAHSKYLEVLLGPHGKLKTALVKYITALAPASLREEQVPLLLTAYTGTLHPSDTALLALLKMHEAEGSLSHHLPLVFGPTAARHYAAAGWKAPKSSELLLLLEKSKVQATCNRFPLNLALEVETSEDQEEAVWGLYDPRFLLPWLHHLLDEVHLDKHLRIIDSGVLALALALTSSGAVCIRSAAYSLLHLIFTSLQAAKLAQEKQVWLHVLSLVKHGVAGRARGSRIPPLLTNYLNRMVEALLDPSSPLYRPLSKALTAKPSLDLGAVPEFQRLHRSPKQEEQAWLLDMLKEGVRANCDYQLLARARAPKLLLSHYNSTMSNQSNDAAVLEVVAAMVATNFGCVDLVAKQGLLPWLTLVVRQSQSSRVTSKVISMVETIGSGLRGVDKRREDAGEEWQNLEVVSKPAMIMLLDALAAKVHKGEEEQAVKRLQEQWNKV